MLNSNENMDFDKMYKESLQSLCCEEVKKDDIFTIIKENISLTDNESFFRSKIIKIVDKIVKIIDTGVGKSYNTAYLLLYKLFYTTEKIIVSTTKNENVRDIQKEIIKVLKECINNIMDLNKREELFILIKKKDFFKQLGICEVTSMADYKETLKTSRAIITNHSYFYSFEKSTTIRNSSKKMMEFLSIHDTILIDEFDEFEKQALTEIQINKFYKHSFTLDGKPILKTTESIFVSRDRKDYYDNLDKHRFETAINDYKMDFDTKGPFDEPYYRPDVYSGNINLKELLDKYFYVFREFDDKSEFLADDREGFYIKTKDNELLNVLMVTTIKELEFDKSKDDVDFKLNNDCDFVSLLRYSHGILLFEAVITLTHKKRDDNKKIISNTEVKRFCNVDDFILWLKNNTLLESKLITEEEEEAEKNESKGKYGKPLKTYDRILRKLITIHRDLYKQYIVIRKKSILDVMNCKKYRYTATPSILEKLGYTLDYDNRKAPHKIKEIDIFLIKMEQGEDKKVAGVAMDKCNNRKINVLTFLAEKRILDSVYSKNKDNNNYSGIKVITTKLEEDGVNLKSHPVIFGDTTRYITRIENVTMSYLNGTLSTGKNFSDTDLLLMNFGVEINIRGRAIISDENKTFESKRDAALRVLIQACGRIERGSKLHKFIMLVGNDENLIHEYIKAKKENGIKYNLKIIKSHQIPKVLNYIENKINDNQISYLDDERIKYNSDEVVKYYLDISGSDEEVDAKKATIDKFGLNRSRFYKILKEYKCK